jgi:hypothetical protein
MHGSRREDMILGHNMLYDFMDTPVVQKVQKIRNNKRGIWAACLVLSISLCSGKAAREK